jgi:hypothetical protein
MPTPEGINDLPKAIQLALAPVFLLTGIAGILNVMTGRLSRITDRGRALTEGRPGVEPTADVLGELIDLETRRHFVGVAITACTVAALLLCITIASLFLELMLGAEVHWLVGGLFTGSTLALVVGLAYFLREVHLATRRTRRWLPPGK